MAQPIAPTGRYERMGHSRRFRRQHHRTDTPLFRGITDQKITDTWTSYLLAVGAPMAYIHATEKCGFMVTDENADAWSDDDIEEWMHALCQGADLYGEPIPEGYSPPNPLTTPW
jgi:hypothetical protein